MALRATKADENPRNAASGCDAAVRGFRRCPPSSLVRETGARTDSRSSHRRAHRRVPCDAPARCGVVAGVRRRRRAQNTNAEKRVADSRTRFNRSSARQTRRGSRRSIRFAKLVLERIAPFPTGVRIATFRRATPTRCGASWQAKNVGCCGSAPPTSVKRCGGRLPPMAQGSCRAIRLARLTLDPMTIERLTRRAPAAIINFFVPKMGDATWL
jgi:hypothetical protein